MQTQLAKDVNDARHNMYTKTGKSEKCYLINYVLRQTEG